MVYFIPMSKNNNINYHIGQAIRSNRKAREFTLTQLAEKLRISYQQLQKYEMGTNRVTADKIYEISRILNIDILSFYPGKEENSSMVDENKIKIGENYMLINDDKLQKSLVELTVRIAKLCSGK